MTRSPDLHPRETQVREAFRSDFSDYVGPATAWTQSILTVGLLAAEIAILWNLPGVIDLPFFGAVTPHEFVADDLLVTAASAVVGAGLGLMANGDVSEVHGSLPGGLLATGLVPAGVNLLLPAVGAYGIRKVVEGASIGIAKSLDKRATSRRKAN